MSVEKVEIGSAQRELEPVEQNPAGLGEGMALRVETSADPTAVKEAEETGVRSSLNPAEYVSRVIDRLIELRRELMLDAGN